MTENTPLIQSEGPAHLGWRNGPVPPKPHCALVFATATGELVSYGGRGMTRAEYRKAHNWTRYEVDTGMRSSRMQLASTPLPARDDAYHFDALIDVTFRVTDPVAVVRDHVMDGLAVVSAAIAEWLRPLTRNFAITEAAAAEREINTRFRQVTLPEGITVTRCVAHLSLDDDATAYVRQLVDAGRRKQVGRAQHDVRLQEAQYDEELAGMEQRARLAGEELERQALAGRVNSLESVLGEHMVRNPGDTQFVVEQMVAAEEARVVQYNLEAERQARLLTEFGRQGLLQAGEIPQLRSAALGRSADGATASAGAIPRAPSVGGWDEPLPDVPVGRSSGGGEDRAQGRVSSVLPVYLAIDESLADSDYLEAAEAGAAELVAQLAEERAVVNTLRLEIIGVSNAVHVRMPLTTVSANGFQPTFRSGGPLRLARLFDDLSARIPRDIEPLKAHGVSVGRPTLYLLCGSRPVDGDQWPAAHAALTDKTSFRYAPNIVACGIGGADAHDTAAIAYHPTVGYAAPAYLSAADAARAYLRYLASVIAQLAVAHGEGKQNAVMGVPAGFVRAEEVAKEETDA